MQPDRRFPLAWPGGWKRAAQRKYSPLRGKNGKRDLSVYEATDRLWTEMRRLLNTPNPSFVLSTNLVLRRDGWPRSDQKEPNDPGVAVYFRLGTRDQVLACDLFTTVADNIGAIAKHIEALRTQDRYGVGTMEQAFAGYVALPSPVADAIRWWEVLRVDRTDVTLEEAESQYRALAREHHADRGGTHEAMVKLNAAIEAARKELA